MQLNRKEKLIQNIILKIVGLLNDEIIFFDSEQILFKTVNISVHKTENYSDENLVDDIAVSFINKIGFNVLWKAGSDYNFEIIDLADFDDEIIVLFSYGYGYNGLGVDF